LSADGGERPAGYPRWVLIFSAVVALSSALPHVHQACTVPQGEIFTGIVESHQDQNLYLVWCRQAMAGRVMMENFATAEEAPPIFVGPHWLVIGTLARFIPLPLIVTYRILAVALAFIYLLIVWRLLCAVLEDERARLFALVIVALGSGFRTFVAIIHRLLDREVLHSADVMPELWAYHSFLLPHFTLALCLMALLTLLLVRAWPAPTGRGWLGIALVGAAMTSVHPYNIAVWGPLLLLHAAISLAYRALDVRAVMANVAALLGAGGMAGLYVLGSHSNPMLAAWAEQNVLRSPPPLSYLMGLGVVLPLAIVGRFVISRDSRHGPAMWLLVLWPLVTAVMVYSYPLVPFERRGVEGLHIPLAILAGAAMAGWVIPWLRERVGERRAIGVAMALLLVMILPTNLKLQYDSATTPMGRMPRGWLEAYEWLAEQTPDDARIFTSIRVGQYCARYALRHVYVGHVQVTVDAERKEDLAGEFFRITTAPERRAEILRGSGCGWLAATSGQEPAVKDMPGLEKAYDAGDMVIYRVPDAGPPPRLQPISSTR
jgi:hypothetical protein